MTDPRNFPGLATAFLQYLRLRHRKKLLGPDFLIRSLGFNRRRLLNPHPIRVDSPLVATLAITSKCPLACYHCSEGYKSNYELPLPVVLATIAQIVETGCPAIALTGGEPFLRKELLEIIDRIPLSVMTVIYTSGLGLDRDLAAELGRRRNLVVCFSIDHPDPEEHDRRRGRKGSHQAALQGIELLGKGKVELHVSTIADRSLVQSGRLHEFARELWKRGVTCVQFFQPRPVGRLDYGLELFLSPEDERKLAATVEAIQQDPSAPLVLSYPALESGEALGCCGGYARVYIDSHGHVCPCDFLPLSFGNLTQEPFAAIWKRMRGFYDRPGSKCQVREHPEIFAVAREGRNVDFAGLADPERLRSASAGRFRQIGEPAYRRLLANLMIASIAAHQGEAKDGHE